MHTIAQWRQKLLKGEVSSLELIDETISRIESIDNTIHSYLYVNKDKARFAAAKIDEARAAGETLPPLAGIPLAIKDNLCTQGIPTTCSSRMLETFVPPYESTVTERLWKAGGI